MYFPFFKPQTGGKRSATQPQTICSEFPLYNRATHATMAAMTQNAARHTTVITEQTPEARV